MHGETTITATGYGKLMKDQHIKMNTKIIFTSKRALNGVVNKTNEIHTQPHIWQIHSNVILCWLRIQPFTTIHT